MTERLHFHFSLSWIGKGNGNPLQCSCLENPRDGGAWWAAIYGVAQSWTRLKQLSIIIQLSSVQSLSHIRLFVTPGTAARQASLSITSSRSLLKLMSIESVMPSNHLILRCPLLLPPSIFPSIRIFSNEFQLTYILTYTRVRTFKSPWLIEGFDLFILTDHHCLMSYFFLLCRNL